MDVTLHLRESGHGVDRHWSLVVRETLPQMSLLSETVRIASPLVMSTNCKSYSLR